MPEYCAPGSSDAGAAPDVIAPAPRSKSAFGRLRRRKQAEIDAQLEGLAQHRPFFTYYAMLTQARVSRLSLSS